MSPSVPNVRQLILPTGLMANQFTAPRCAPRRTRRPPHGVRSISVGVTDGEGVVRASMNVTVHAQQTSIEKLVNEYLPLLQNAARETSADWARWQSRPVKTLK